MKSKLLYKVGRFLEQRSGLSEPDNWLVNALGGNTSTTGVRVTENDAMKYSAVYACVRVLAESIASLPLPVYKRTAAGKEKAPRHYLYPILHDMANEEMTSFAFRETMMAHLVLWGNAYAEIERNNAGEIVGLWPLLPDKTWPERKKGRLIYKTILADGTQVILPKERIFHVAGLGFNGIVGFSPITMAKEAIGLGLAAEEYGARFFGNGAKPSGVVIHPNTLTQEAQDRLRSSWNTMHQGLSNQHRIAILEEGMQYQQIGIPPEDAQFLETRKYQINEIARIYRVPPHMIGDLERATFSNIEQQSIDFVVNTMRPWLVRWEQAILKDLLTPKERRKYFAEFTVEGLLRGDATTRAQFYNTMFQIGALSQNDIREKENMNPIDDGDTYFVPMNMVPSDMAKEAAKVPKEPKPTKEDSEPEPKEDPEEEEKKKEEKSKPKHEHRKKELRAKKVAANRKNLMNTYKTVFIDVTKRIMKREEADIMRKARKMLGSRDIDQFDNWLSDFYTGHESYIEKNMLPALLSYSEIIAADVMNEIGEEIASKVELEEFVRSYLKSYIKRHSGLSINKLRSAMEGATDEIIEALQEEFDTWQEQRANDIAAEEINRAGNAFARFSYGLLGVTLLRDVANAGACPYCKEIDGKVVGIQQNFFSKGDEIDPENADGVMRITTNKANPPWHAGCECVIVAD